MATSSPAAPRVSRTQYLPWGIGAAVAHMVIMIHGYHEESDGSFQTAEWFTMLAVSLVLATALFMFVVPTAGPTGGIVLGVVAVLSVLVFWAGITGPIAAAAAVVGWRLRASGDGSARPKLVLGLAALAVVAVVAIIIGDAMAGN